MSAVSFGATSLLSNNPVRPIPCDRISPDLAIFPLPGAVLPPFLQTQTQFGGNTLFQKALKDAFNDLVNRDVGKFKTADLIASFCDRYVGVYVVGVPGCVLCAVVRALSVNGA
jgi:hypothetical protein